MVEWLLGTFLVFAPCAAALGLQVWWYRRLDAKLLRETLARMDQRSAEVIARSKAQLAAILAEHPPAVYTVSDGKLTLTLEPVAEGGYVVRSPGDPSVVTQAESIEEAFENARDAASLLAATRAG